MGTPPLDQIQPPTPRVISVISVKPRAISQSGQRNPVTSGLRKHSVCPYSRRWVPIKAMAARRRSLYVYRRPSIQVVGFVPVQRHIRGDIDLAGAIRLHLKWSPIRVASMLSGNHPAHGIYRRVTFENSLLCGHLLVGRSTMGLLPGGVGALVPVAGDPFGGWTWM